MSYDSWKTSAPEAFGYPVRCTECKDYVHGSKAEDLAGRAHDDCRDEDTGEVGGVWEYDENYDFSYDDPRIP
jgi:hypothetical protein